VLAGPFENDMLSLLRRLFVVGLTDGLGILSPGLLALLARLLVLLARLIVLTRLVLFRVGRSNIDLGHRIFFRIQAGNIPDQIVKWPRNRLAQGRRSVISACFYPCRTRRLISSQRAPMTTSTEFRKLAGAEGRVLP
jgi:hypothetical protein